MTLAGKLAIRVVEIDEQIAVLKKEQFELRRQLKTMRGARNEEKRKRLVGDVRNELPEHLETHAQMCNPNQFVSR
jgi:hypothetical protein